VTTIGFSGHQDLPPGSVGYIEREIRSYLVAIPAPLVGVSSLAAGADQLFAQLVIDAGGTLRAVIPSRGYASTFPDARSRERYETLLRAADAVCLDFPAPSDDAYLAAGQAVTDAADRLLAVWDGRRARGRGGTADIVAYAQRTGKPVTVVWPAGAQR
jgi:hypothetical protein